MVPQTLSLDALSAAIQTSTTSTMTFGDNGVAVVNPLTVKKPSRFKKIFGK